MKESNPTLIKPLKYTSRRDVLKQLIAGLGLTAAGVLDSAAALGSESVAASSYAPKTYTNPVFSGSMPDPFAFLHQGVYYALGTTGNERRSDGRIFTLLRSINLVDWQELGGALLPPTADRHKTTVICESRTHRNCEFSSVNRGPAFPRKMRCRSELGFAF
ncbi:MAG TPA: hypothetical protein VI750_00730 [Pyrinomonadaceae bacterium]|nr:hypothetical protein [Pyrinomonadaceae bacterium]